MVPAGPGGVVDLMNDPSSPDEHTDDAGEHRVLVPQPQAVRAALATLPSAEAGHDFWDEVDREIAQGTPLHLAPRPAIRPITEPPPASGTPGTPIEDVFERGGHRGPAFGRKPGVLTGTQPGMSRKRLVILVAVAVVVVFLALGTLLSESPDDPDLATGDDTDEAEAEDEDDGSTADEGDDGEGEGNSDADGSADEPESPGTTLPPQPQSLEPESPIQPGGVGLVRNGSTTLRDMALLNDVEPVVNHGAFNVSGGRCFDVTVPGADGLTWWVASPTGEPLAEPEDGTVVALSMGGVMSPRQTADGFGLGAPGEELRTFYAGRVQIFTNPFNTQGAIYVVSSGDGTGTALAYWTNDEDNVAEIRSGREDLLARPDMCL
jgi:hypothetical protein